MNSVKRLLSNVFLLSSPKLRYIRTDGNRTDLGIQNGTILTCRKRLSVNGFAEFDDPRCCPDVPMCEV